MPEDVAPDSARDRAPLFIGPLWLRVIVLGIALLAILAAFVFHQPFILGLVGIYLTVCGLAIRHFWG